MILGMGRGNKGNDPWILLGWKTEDPENVLLSISEATPEIKTWGDI